MSRAGLSPWRAFRYFEGARESYPTLPTGQVVRIAPLEVRRVVLVIGLTDQPCPFNIGTNPNLVVGGNLTIDAKNLPIVITQAEWGALCQQAWYAANFSSPPGNLYVLEQLLLDWPMARPVRDVFDG